MMQLDRRVFIRSVAIGSSLVLEWSMSEASVPQQGLQPNAWLTLHEDGRIDFRLDKCEMGQGVYTALAMIVAEELDVDPKSLSISMAMADRVYGNPDLLGLQMTGGSTSVRAAYGPLRRAGAAARQMLVAAAASTWKVAPSECHSELGRVLHTSGKSLRYGELVKAAQQQPVPTDPPLKNKKDFRWLGKPMPRLDAPLKVRGQATFGIDVKLEDLLHAVLLRSPVIGGKLKAFKDGGALKSPGVVAVLAIDAGVAVVAKRYHQALRAMPLVQAEWDLGELSRLDTETLQKSMAEEAAAKRAGAAAALGEGEIALKAEYSVPYLAHAAMEPSNCTARVSSELCEVWAPTQSPTLAEEAAREASGLDVAQIRIYSTFVGGGFGRRLAQDYVYDAVQLAKLLGKPVKIIATRESDTKNDYYRPISAHALQANLSKDGRLTSLTHAIAGPSILAQTLPSWIPAIVSPKVPALLRQGIGNVVGFAMGASGNDDTSVEGAKDTPYAWPQHEVAYSVQDPGVPVGFFRSVGHSYTGFVVESFVDEIAHAQKQNPVALRRQLLRDKPKHLAVLDLAISKSRYPGGGNDNIYCGVALHESFRSIVCQVVEVEKTSASAVKIKRIVVAADLGQVINPLGVEAQLTGSVVFALTAALYGKISIKNGQIEQGNFDSYPLLRMPEVPPIEVHIVPSEEAPRGIGEPGVPPLAAALANAIFAATGRRERHLPLRLS